MPSSSRTSNRGILPHKRSKAFEAVAPNAVSGGSGWLIKETININMSAEEDNEETLSLFLYISASCDSTDMRDKVHGMLAILSSVFGGIITPPVDYSKTLPRVFEDFTLAMIGSTRKSFDLLELRMYTALTEIILGRLCGGRRVVLFQRANWKTSRFTSRVL